MSERIWFTCLAFGDLYVRYYDVHRDVHVFSFEWKGDEIIWKQDLKTCVIFVADTVCGEKYSCGAILFHVTELLLMWSNFVMWGMGKLFHNMYKLFHNMWSNMPLLYMTNFSPHDKLTLFWHNQALTRVSISKNLEKKWLHIFSLARENWIFISLTILDFQDF